MSLVQHKEMWSYDVFKIHLKEKPTIAFLAGLFLVINIKLFSYFVTVFLIILWIWDENKNLTSKISLQISTWEKKNFRGLSYLYQIRAKSYDHVWPDPYLPIKDYLPILLRGIYKEIGENIGKTCSAVHFRLIIGWNNFSMSIIIFLQNS